MKDSSMIQTFKHFINGEWVDSDSRKAFPSINPANKSEVLGNFQQGTEKDVEKAVEAAQKAFKSWSEMPAPKRGEILFEVSRLLKENKERLAKLVTLEMGKQ